MMGYSAANLTVLYRLQPELRAKALEDAEPPTGFEVVETPSGSPTARLHGTYLHSRYDPAKEARRIVNEEAGATASAGIVLGFGFGYLVEAFCEAFPGKALVVVEQDTGLFLQALKTRDLRNLLSLPNIHWHLGDEPEAVMMSIEALPLQQLCILRLRPLLASRSEYYHRVEALLFSVFDKREVNINTLRRFGQLWVRNLLSNLDRFAGNPGISVARNRFPGVPALVMAAGPSLDEVLPHLKALKEHMLIVAVDTSYRFCKNQGGNLIFWCPSTLSTGTAGISTGWSESKRFWCLNPPPTRESFAVEERRKKWSCLSPPSFPWENTSKKSLDSGG